jgi:hypothetical protein
LAIDFRVLGHGAGQNPDRIVATIAVAGKFDACGAAAIPERLKALLSIAGKVQGDGENVTEDDIHRARLQGATEVEIRDTVLIASMFCMCDGKGWRTDSTTARRSRASARRKLKCKTNRKEK